MLAKDIDFLYYIEPSGGQIQPRHLCLLMVLTHHLRMRTEQLLSRSRPSRGRRRALLLSIKLVEYIIKLAWFLTVASRSQDNSSEE